MATDRKKPLAASWRDSVRLGVASAQFADWYAIGRNVPATVMGHRTCAFKGDAAPSAWGDLGNAKASPGRRALRKFPFDAAGESLMAVGVAPGLVYPRNLDAVFKSLAAVKPRIDSSYWPTPQDAAIGRFDEWLLSQTPLPDTRC